MSPSARQQRARDEAEQQCHDWRRERDQAEQPPPEPDDEPPPSNTFT